MIHISNDFFKVSSIIKTKYFPEVVHRVTKNDKYYNAIYAIELFNNGCLTYRQLMSKLSKACNDTTFNINSIVETFIVSFGEYRYKPTK